MPYIIQEKRKGYKEFEDTLERLNLTIPGDLNYLVHKVCLKYLKDSGIHYCSLSDVLGVLADVIDEIRTRLMRPYENAKRETNGDVGYTELIYDMKEKLTDEYLDIYGEVTYE